MRKLNPFRRSAVGLALGSGGAKGIAHIGVIEQLETFGVPIDMISGSSIGALVGALYCCGTLPAFKKNIFKMSRSQMLMLTDPVMPRSGLLEGEKLLEFLVDYIPEEARIEEMPLPFTVTATDYHTGKGIVFDRGNLLNALRASIATPGVFTPVEYGEYLLMDGGVAQPLPIEIVKKMGATDVIAVSLHPKVGPLRLKRLVKEKKSGNGFLEMYLAPGFLSGKGDRANGKEEKSWIDTLFSRRRKGVKKNLPSIFDVVVQSLDIMEYISTYLMIKYSKPAVLIEPAVQKVSTIDFSQAAEAYSLGLLACNEKKAELYRKIKRRI